MKQEIKNMLFLKEFMNIAKKLEKDFENENFIKEILLQREKNKYSKKLPGNALNNHLRDYLLKNIKFPISENRPLVNINDKHHTLCDLVYECDLFNTKSVIFANIVKTEDKNICFTVIVEKYTNNTKNVDYKEKINFIFDNNYKFEFVHYDALDKTKDLYHKIDIRSDNYKLEVGKFTYFTGRKDRNVFEFNHFSDLLQIKEILLLQNDYKLDNTFITNCFEIKKELDNYENKNEKKPNI